MTAEARIAALRAEADRLESTSCTGLTAAWCPVHGDRRCGDLDADGEGNRREHEVGPMSDPNCPLHAVTSSHAEAGVE